MDGQRYDLRTRAGRVLALRNSSGRRRIIVVEAKTRAITDRKANGAVIQLAMYLPWVIKRLAGYAACTDPLVVTPVVLGRQVGNIRGGDQHPNVAGLGGFNDTFRLQNGTVNVEFEPMQFVEYEPVGVTPGTAPRCTSVNFTNRGSGDFGALVDWVPHHGLPATEADRRWVRENPWADARQLVGLPR